MDGNQKIFMGDDADPNRSDHHHCLTRTYQDTCSVRYTARNTGYHLDIAAAPDPGPGRRHLDKDFHGFLSSCFLDEANDGVEQEDSQYYPGVYEVPHDNRDYRGNQEHINERAEELPGENHQWRGLLLAFELVGAVP